MKLLGTSKYGLDSFQPIGSQKKKPFFKANELSTSLEIYNSQSWSYKDLPKRYAEFVLFIDMSKAENSTD